MSKIDEIRRRYESAKDYGIAFGFNRAQMGHVLTLLQQGREMAAQLEEIGDNDTYVADKYPHLIMSAKELLDATE